jgi:prepilin-type N-terminal cleavage/methylation domain-containing protein
MHSLRKHMRTKGFTVTELAIVISVIGVLAVILITSYRGVQQRALNSQVGANASMYIKLLTSYYASNRSYPTIASSVCLGTDYPSDKCWLANVNENAAFMAQLQTYAGGSTLPTATAGVYLTGIMFTPASYGNKLDGVNTNFVAYIVSGANTQCPVGPVATFQSGQLFSSAAPTSGQSVAANSSGDVQCWVALPS